jgi:aldose 1-epimerase
VTPENAFVIEYEATTDAPTVASMTSHTYFNLAGHGRADAATAGAHTLMLPARFFTPVDETQLPTGELRAVAGTPMDFTRPHRIDARQDDDDEQLRPGLGYDHNWAIDKAPGAFGLVARLADPLSGRVMEVLSTEPGLVFYGGNFLEGLVPRDVGKDGVVYRARAGLCLEPAGFPGRAEPAPVPSTLLLPGETYRGKTAYAFSTE